MAGDKLERLHRVGVGDVSAFVTGRVLEAEQHPDADRLTVCQVDVGRGDPQTIVCGAPNVAAGQTVAVALPARSCRTARRWARRSCAGSSRAG